MKQTILKKLLVSGAAALGIMGLSTPAAFAWSGNSNYGSYNSYRPSYSHYSYNSYNKKKYSPCYRNDYDSDNYPSYWNGYGMKNNRNNSESNSTSVAVAVAFAFSSSSSSSNSFNNYRW